MRTRREFISGLAVGAFVLMPLGRAQSQQWVHRIGVLSPGPTLQAAEYQTVWDPLRDLGWIEGQNLVFERRWAEGKPERLVPLAQELVRLNVELIASIGTDATLAAKNATTRIPIVMLSSGDPVRTGLVASLAHPGGNVTGISMVAPELEAKRATLLREILPELHRVGVLVDPATAIAGYSREETERAYQALGIQPIVIEVSSADGIDGAVAEAVRRQAQALVVHADVLFYRNQAVLMRTVIKHRLPTAVEGKELLAAGGLISYENDTADQVKRFATFVDRILRGAKPSDLPIEQPTRFKFMLNMKTAKSLGIAIPESVQLRADEIIQ